MLGKLWHKHCRYRIICALNHQPFKTGSEPCQPRLYLRCGAHTAQKGKSTGTLHEVKPIDLAAGLLVELQKRHDLDTSYVDDVVMGRVSPVGEQGSDVAKMVVQNAEWDESVPGVQLDRFCASGLEAVNIAAQKVASGWEDLVVAGGVESMSRVPMGSNGGAMAGTPNSPLRRVSCPRVSALTPLPRWRVGPGKMLTNMR